MKFNKQINNGTLLIPGGAFKISGFEGGEKVEIHTLDSAVVVLKKQMTTMELIQAMDALHRLATVPFPVSWTVKMKKKQKETQDILSYHSQAAGCSDKTRAKASGGRQPIEECGRTGL